MPGVLFYMDDILVMGNSDEELCENTIAVMKRLSAYNLKIQLSKMRLWEDQVKVLGVIFSGTGKRIDPEKMQAISTYPAIDTLKKTQSFLGMCAFFFRHLYPITVLLLNQYFRCSKIKKVKILK